ncbi:MAG TPA: hypothetical protein VNO24_04635 [Blastocatellia bacterium]|nr:hypothetical protein [Blastocatellia bacterium]
MKFLGEGSLASGPKTRPGDERLRAVLNAQIMQRSAAWSARSQPREFSAG